jgi:hypothetical protein
MDVLMGWCGEVEPRSEVRKGPQMPRHNFMACLLDPSTASGSITFPGMNV